METKRTRKPKENKKIHQINIRLTEYEKRILEDNANQRKLNITDYILFLVENDIKLI